ncbi:hypothetical protein WJX81_001348 [Elliptochloris bilobata]|uniref:Uncharacterized protein n=1 Tax=Elliptochloris bilobata TaxID=381761 RepID=A0AAW1RTB1_9CHLO
MASGQPPVAPNTVEQEQEALLKVKYGALQPKKKLLPKDHKYFDSADYQLAKQGVQSGEAPVLGGSQLAPKLAKSAAPPRRASHLGEEEA